MSNLNQSKIPSHIAYHVQERGSDDSFWTRIGTAWKHADGNGFNLQLETIPLGGKVTLRTFPEKKN